MHVTLQELGNLQQKYSGYCCSDRILCSAQPHCGMGKVGDVHEPMLYACIAVEAASRARYVDSILCFGCYVVMWMQRFVNLAATGGEGR